MKTTAIIDQGFMNPSYFSEFFAQVRKESDCDNLIIITTGNFKRNASFTPFDYKDRFEAMVAAGADLIFRHPVNSTCLRNPYFNFSLTSFINKMRLIDELYLPIADDSPQSLSFADKFIFDLKLSYSTVLCKKTLIPDGYFLKNTDSAEKETRFLSCVQSYFSEHGTKTEMLEIFGGTDTLIDYLLDNISIINTSTDLAEMITTLANSQHSAEKIRHFLMHCVMNLRKLDHSIMALYEYSPYAHIVFENKDNTAVTDTISEKGYIQQVHSYNDAENCTNEINPSKQLLYFIEDKFCSMF